MPIKVCAVRIIHEEGIGHQTIALNIAFEILHGRRHLLNSSQWSRYAQGMFAIEVLSPPGLFAIYG